MAESLSLLFEVGEVGGVGGVERGGVDDIVEPVGVTVGFWSTKLVPPSVVDSFSWYSGLLIICLFDDPLSLCVLRSDSWLSSKVVCGRGGAPSCVGRSKWILRKEGAI